MAFFTISTAEENIKDGGTGSKYILDSGIYEILIKHVIVDVTKNGSQVINLNFDYDGQNQTIFQAMRLTNNDGSANFGAQLFTKMAVVLGAGDGAEIEDPVSVKLALGKSGEMKDYSVLEQFSDQPILMRVQMEYSLYEGKIQERKVIKNFFDVTSHASASEIVNNADDKGAQYEKELEYASNITYKDGLTPEDIEKWKKNGRKSEAKEEPKKPTSFGQRRTFGKN